MKQLYENITKCSSDEARSELLIANLSTALKDLDTAEKFRQYVRHQRQVCSKGDE